MTHWAQFLSESQNSGAFRVGSPPYDHAVKPYLFVEAPADAPKPPVASLNPINCNFIHLFLEGWLRCRKKTERETNVYFCLLTEPSRVLTCTQFEPNEPESSFVLWQGLKEINTVIHPKEWQRIHV